MVSLVSNIRRPSHPARCALMLQRKIPLLGYRIFEVALSDVNSRVGRDIRTAAAAGRKRILERDVRQVWSCRVPGQLRIVSLRGGATAPVLCGQGGLGVSDLGPMAPGFRL